MSARYAAKTDVPTLKTKQEIEVLLMKHGATKFASMWEEDRAAVSFVMHGRHIRFTLPLPRRDDKRFVRNGKNVVRTMPQREQAWEQECRTSWRGLLLIVRAKLEAIAAKVASFDDEFLSYIVLQDGNTVGEKVAPQLDSLISSGAFLLGPRSSS